MFARRPAALRSRHQSTGAQFLCTTLIRRDADGAPVECDVLLTFASHCTARGCAARTYGDPADCYPAEGNEWEHELIGIAFDAPGCAAPDDAPGALTPLEIADMDAWFDAHQREADEIADGNAMESV
ncbi:MAG TPA: hypothetical protein VNW90_23090 [Acetobacteraceae bacterium]|nr:hypothetical protein [Acetobacteraceae bacterium]